MKLILIQDVPKIGRKYETKDVRDGFGRNFLLARNLAILWDEKKEKECKARIETAKAGKIINDDLLSKNLAGLDGFKIIMSAMANKAGHLFAGVKAKDIADEIKKQHGIAVPESAIELEQAIKNTGIHKIKAGKSEFSLEILGTDK